MSAYQSAVSQLREVLERVRVGEDAELGKIVQARDSVLARYRPIFAPSHISGLTAEEFRSFLQFENNHHWSGINRWGTIVTYRMEVLRDTLALLLNESVPIRERVDAVLTPGGRAKISGLGKAVVTPILLISQPLRYGVWNEPAESGMVRLGIWPVPERGVTEGEKYERINRLLLRLAEALEIDLWTLDALWWRLSGLPIASVDVDEDFSGDDFESAIQLLEELDEAAPLDDRRMVAVRMEQGFIRQQLFKGKQEQRCTICGHPLPVDLLRAAHIKRRASCSPDERRDYQHNVVPMCTLGCDELFERGYIVVQGGYVASGRRDQLTPKVADYISTVVGRPCIAYYRGSGHYFDWHAESHT